MEQTNSEAFKCYICHFGNIFYQHGKTEPWFHCKCTVRVHMSCIRNVENETLCECSEESWLPILQKIGDFVKITDEYKKYQNLSLEEIIRHGKSIPNVMGWTSAEIKDFCQALNIYSDVFFEKDIDGSKFIQLTFKDLEELSLERDEALKIYKHIRVLRWKEINDFNKNR